MRFTLLAITSATLCAQGPEIRGSVAELGSLAPLQGAEVTLSIFSGRNTRLVATTFTGKDGAFSFKPEAFGQYQIELKKPGYTISRGFSLSSFFLSADRPLMELPPFTLMNPSTVTGRLLDEHDKPLAGFRVLLADPLRSALNSSAAVTESDGTFTLTGVAAGTFSVRAVPASQEFPKIEEYTDAAFERLDQGWEDVTAAPFVVAPGSVATLGTLRLRQTERYRIRLNIQGDCSGQSWTVSLSTTEVAPNSNLITLPTPCKQQLLLTNVPSGSHQIALWTDDAPRWAAATFLITRSNVSVNLAIAHASDLPGRIVTSQGVPPPPVTGANFQLMMRPVLPGLSNTDAQEPQVQTDLTFVGYALRWDSYLVSAPRIPAGYYLREIRYKGRPVTNGRIDLLPGAQLEFELDNQPARVFGSINQEGPAFIRLAKVPYDIATTGVEGNAPFSYSTFAQDGRFELTGLAPGEYRIAAALDPAQLAQLIQTGDKITLERGQQRTVQLRVSPRDR